MLRPIQQRGDLQKAIINKLDELTYRREVLWEIDGQVYRTNYKNLVFEIEDSGNANWLTITTVNLLRGRDSLAIPDQHEEVARLLDTIKYRTALELVKKTGQTIYSIDQELNLILATLS